MIQIQKKYYACARLYNWLPYLQAYMHNIMGIYYFELNLCIKYIVSC